MDYKELIERLRDHGGHFAMYGADFSDTCTDAAAAIETLLKEREGRKHAHVVVNWLGNCRCSACGTNIDCTSKFCCWCGAALDGPEEREN